MPPRPPTNEDFKPLDILLQQMWLVNGDENIWDGFVWKKYHYDSATPSTCSPDCCHCTHQWVPFTARIPSTTKITMHDDATAASTVKHLIQSTQEHHAYVRQKINTHGDAIAKRWQKMNLVARQALVKTAMPKMFEHRDSDMNIMLDDQERLADRIHGCRPLQNPQNYNSQKAGRAEDPYLVPFLNTQVLSEDKMRLLAMMHYRTAVNQTEWTLFDKEAILDEFHSGALKTAYNPHCVSFNSRNHRFGELVQWEKESAHRWDMIGYPMARHILRMQSKIAKFLRDMVDLILETSAVEVPQGSNTWYELVATSFKSTNGRIRKSAYSNPAFAPAPKFDLDHIINLLQIRHDHSLDEVLLVTSDPVYLRHRVSVTESLNAYKLQDSEGKRHTLFMLPFQEMFRYETWDCLYVCAVVQTIIGNAPLSISAPTPIFEQHEKGLLCLEAVLRVSFNQLADGLRDVINSHPSFRKHFDGPKQLTAPRVAFYEDPMFWVLSELAGQNYEGIDRSASWCFTSFEDHLSKADRKERNRIDQTLSDHLSDMSAIDEVLTALKHNKSHACIGGRKGSEEECLKSCYRSPEIHTALQAFYALPLTRKAGSEEKLAENKLLHEKFAAYWQLVHTSVMKQVRRSDIPGLLKDGINVKLSEYRGGQVRTYKLQQTAIRQAIDTKAKSAQVTHSGSFHAPSYVPVYETITGKTIAKDNPSKAKVKTRPQTSALDALIESVETTKISDSTGIPTPSVCNPIKVKPKTVGFFTQMFSTLEIPKGRVQWEELVAAMVDSGCSATATGGSAVVFKDEANKKGSIVLHKPHPDPMIDLIMLRAIGKWLTKWFGWNKETFVEWGSEAA